MAATLRARLALIACLLVSGGASAENPRTGAPEHWPESMPGMLHWLFSVEELEHRVNDSEDLLRWDAEGWVGGDVHKLWLKTEGEVRTQGPGGGDAELQLLYGHLLAPFWDLQIGARQDFVFGSGPDRERTFAAIGVEGLAPGWFEVTPTLFVSQHGDVSARLTASVDLLLSQRLVAQPRFELNAAASDSKRFGIERGFNDVELGLRLRYEVWRELAPYVGVNWHRRLGNTENLARRRGEDASVVGFVAGIRAWF